MAKRISREEYAGISLASAEVLQKMSEHLAELARFMRADKDYTGSILVSAEKVSQGLPQVSAEVKLFIAATKKRGGTLVDEQIADLASKKADILAGKPVKILRCNEE